MAKRVETDDRVDLTPSASTEAGARLCFVVMPFGRDPEEERWFRGWYEEVIHPAILECDFEPVLAATEDEPSAINDQIRRHLAFDAMVVVDLGGRTPLDPPNPNVMYELGIRHAFGLPLVLMAWEGQKLPFDVSNQRAITSKREFLDLKSTREKLSRFIRAAELGQFYKPMDAVGREAAIDAASMNLNEDSLLGALTNEIRDLRSVITHSRPRPDRTWNKPRTVKSFLRKVDRAELWARAQSRGFDANLWGKFLSTKVPEESAAEMGHWGLEEWWEFLIDTAPGLPANSKLAELEPSVLDAVRAALPPQPWPTGTHHAVAEALGLRDRDVSRAIQELIASGVFNNQIDGQVVPLGSSRKDFRVHTPES